MKTNSVSEGKPAHNIVQKSSDSSRLFYGTVFREWQYNLKRGDILPRGKWFKDKKAGKPQLIYDEAHLFLNRNS